MVSESQNVAFRLLSDTALQRSISSAKPDATFSIDGKTFTAQELRVILQQSLAGENRNSANMGLSVEHSRDNDNYTLDKDNNIITYPKEGETFDQTAKRLGLEKDTPEYEEFVRANGSAKKRRWFKVGERIKIPPAIQDKIIKEEIISEEQSKNEVEKWKKRTQKPGKTTGQEKPTTPKEPGEITGPKKPTSPKEPGEITGPKKPTSPEEPGKITGPKKPVPPKKHEIPEKPYPVLDNIYDNSAQKYQGDCYLMATINGLRNIDGGPELLSSLRTKKTVNGKAVYTFSFPGAKLAADALKDSHYKTYITGTYTFTEDQVREIVSKAGIRYSDGDPDTMLLEAAFEKYREQVQKTLRANNIPLDKYWHIAGMVTSTDSNNPLAGGYAHDVAFVLTGKKSEYYLSADNNLPVLSKQALNQNTIVEIQKHDMGIKSKGPISEIDGEIKRKKTELNKMLNKMQKDYESDGKSDLLCMVSFLVGDGKNSGGHAFTVKRVTKDKVIMINPWFPDKDLEISREQFINAARNMSVTKVKPGSFWERITEPYIGMWNDLFG